jgi:hypothetical protein
VACLVHLFVYEPALLKKKKKKVNFSIYSN